MLNELFTADKATGTLLRKRPTGWRARQTEDASVRVSKRKGGENVVLCAGRGSEGRRETGNTV